MNSERGGNCRNDGADRRRERERERERDDETDMGKTEERSKSAIWLVRLRSAS